MAKPTLIKPNGDAAGMRPDQRECIEKLEAVLESAKNGNVWSCCIIACGPGDFGLTIAGADAPRLNLGLDAAKTEIMNRVLGKRTVLHR
jgi:hypothetical protein